MTVVIFTPTRHPGIAVSAHSVARQTHEDVVWLVGDQLDRWELIEKHGFTDTPVKKRDVETHVFYMDIEKDKVGNLAALDNAALSWARAIDADLLIFLQDFIWMPPYGVRKFLEDAKEHPYALLTGCVQASKGFPVVDANDPWDIFGGKSDNTPPLPYELDTRQQFGMQKGRLSNHAWEINYGALPKDLINCGVDFDEDYDYGTQWENTQFSFDIARQFPSDTWGGAGGYVWWNPDNRAVALPHRDYFPKTHEGERAVRNDQLFWKKNPDLIDDAQRRLNG